MEAQARRPRLPQGLRRVQGRHGAQRPADGHPGQDDQGLRPGHPLRRPQRDAPDEEAHPRRPQGLPRHACSIPITDEQLEADPYRPPYYHPGTDDPTRSSTCASAARSSAAPSPSGASSTPRSSCPDDTAYARLKRGSGKQQIATTMAFVRLLKDLMRDKEFGKRIVPIIPDEARTFGMDSFFPTIKIYNPHGQNYTPVDAELMLAYKESDGRPDPARGHQRGRLGGGLHRRRHVLRHARRADDPDLRLLLDVRVPAHRRLDLGGRRPDGPRLPHRRHRRPHHADRRGPAARRRALPAAGGDQPGGRGLRPGLRLRDRAHRQGRPAPDVRRQARRTSSTTSPSTTSRTSSRRSPRTSTSRASCAACTCSRAAEGWPTARRGRSCSPPASACRGRSRPSSCCANDWGVAADVWSVTSWTELRRDGLAATSRRSCTRPRTPGRRT